MQQYFVNQSISVQQSFVLSDKEDCFHLKKVMRAKIGTEVEIVANQAVYCCTIQSLDPEIVLFVENEKIRAVELPVEVTIIQGLPKLDKMDYIVQKATELGAHHIIPWKAKRSIVKYDAKKASQKVERWQKIAKEAAEQSHRNMIPVIADMRTTGEVIPMLSAYDVIFIGSERFAKESNQSFSLLTTLQTLKKGMKVACLIGPEGGIDDHEFAQFLEQKAIEISLGPRILRTETASMYLLSNLSLVLE